MQADALARHARAAGLTTRLQSGTDDHALKNVSSAQAAGVSPGDFVQRNSLSFAQLIDNLGVKLDSFVQTSQDSRHSTTVRKLWLACEASGDLYQKSYSGLYCPGCEQFYAEKELENGLCGEHKIAPQKVEETNWFFRLSRYSEAIRRAIEADAFVIKPVARRNEVLSFLSSGVQDISISRPSKRAQGWGLAVPGDPTQVIYVWFDALANYLTGLDFGANDSAYEEWWSGATAHVVGKGIARFHAVYWPAILLSAGLELPKTLLIHDYLTVNGAKIAKSGPATTTPQNLLDCYGVDALRWWLLSDPTLLETTDFTEERLINRYNSELANSVGNLISRVSKLSRRSGSWRQPVSDSELLTQACAAATQAIGESIGEFDFRQACASLVGLASLGNKFIEQEEPWRLAKLADEGGAEEAQRFEAVIGALLQLCEVVARQLAPFTPAGSARLLEALNNPENAVPAFPRIKP